MHRREHYSVLSRYGPEIPTRVTKMGNMGSSMLHDIFGVNSHGRGIGMLVPPFPLQLTLDRYHLPKPVVGMLNTHS